MGVRDGRPRHERAGVRSARERQREHERDGAGGEHAQRREQRGTRAGRARKCGYAAIHRG